MSLALEIVGEAPSAYERAMAACRMAAERASARPSRAPARRDAYHGGEVSRLTADWTISSLSADDETRWSIRRMRARGRDLARNTPYGKRYLTILAVNVIGATGIDVEPVVANNDGAAADLLNDRIEAAWDQWARFPTLDHRTSITRLQHMLIKSVARDGEVLVRLWRGSAANRFGFALEVIDPDLLDEHFTRAPNVEGENEVRMGVEVNAQGRPVAYHIWSAPVSYVSQSVPRTRERVPADQIIHLFALDRANQTRGVTWFAPSMMAMRQLDGYVEAELIGARVGAAQMGVLQRRENAEGAAVPEPDPDTGNFSIEANPGSFPMIPDGYEMTMFDPKHPNQAFPEFVKKALHGIANGLDIGYVTLTNDLESTSYSSMRSGLEVEHDLWRSLQQWWIDAFLRVVYEEWINWSLLAGALVLDSRDPTRFLEAKFTPRGWGWVDPLDESKAAAIDISAGLTSRTRLLAAQGQDFEEVLAELAAEQDAAALVGLDLTPPVPGGSGAADTSPDAPADSGSKSNGGSGRSGAPNGTIHANGTRALAAALRARRTLQET